MKKLISLLCAGVLATSLCAGLTGCTGGKDYDPDNFIADTTNPQIVKEPITLKVFVPKHSLHASYSSMALFTEASRITNIQFEFVEADVDALEEKRALAWESKKSEMPDLFLFGNEVAEQTQLSKNGAIYPLEDLIEEYAPNYKALMEKYPDIEKISTLNDGHIYSFSSVKNTPRDLTCKQYINTTLLEQAGIEELPTTLGEYKTALQAMKDIQPMSKQANFKPLGNSKLKNTKNFVMSAFGYVETGIEVKHDGSNQVVYVPYEEEYKAYLTYLNELYKDGLLDNDVFETTDNKLIQKGEAGNLGSFDYAADFLVVGYEESSDYEAVGPLLSGGYGGINNTNKVWMASSEVTATTAIIPTTTPYQKEIVRLMDFFYSDYAVQLLVAGKEGTHWNWKDASQSKWEYLLGSSDTNIELFRGTFSPNVGIGAAFYWDKEFVYKQSDAYIDKLNEVSEAYAEYFVEAYPSYVKFTEEELLEIANLERSLNDYIQTFEINCIKGSNGADINADWAEHLATLKSLKVERLVEIYQTALNRAI